MKNVLVISEVRGDTRRYRALHLIEQLELLGVACAFVHLTDFDLPSILRQRHWDIAVFHRLAYSNHVGSIYNTLKRQGTVILSDFDDLIFDTKMFSFINSPDFSDPVREQLYKAKMQDIRTIFEKSECSLVSTNYLAGQIEHLGKAVWVHRNAFSLEMLKHAEQALAQANRKDTSKVVIGYASGTLTHNRDFEMIRPALVEILHRYSHTELWLVGPLDVGADWGTVGDRVRRLPRVPWRLLPGVLYQFDINLAPLVADNPFSQSKSEIKYMEAAMVKTPTVASPTDAFAYAIRSGENGFLAATEEDWTQAISRLIEAPELRLKVGECAYEDVLQAYHPVRRALQLAERLEEISQKLRSCSFWNGPHPQYSIVEQRANIVISRPEWLPLRYEKDPSYFKLGLYGVMHNGIKITLKQVWVFIRRLISPIFPFTSKKQNKL